MTIVAKAGVEVTVSGLDNISTPVVRAETSLGGEPVVVYAMLLASADSDTEARQRNNLLERIADRIGEETVPVAVIGEIGASQWSHAFRVLAGHGTLTDSSPGNGFQGTSPGGAWIGLRVPTQHLLFTDSLTTTDRHLGPDLGHGQSILVGTLAHSAG